MWTRRQRLKARILYTWTPLLEQAGGPDHQPSVEETEQLPSGAVWGWRLHGNVSTPNCFWPGTVTTQQEGNSVAGNTFPYTEFGSPHLHYFELVYTSPIVSLHLSPSSTNHKVTTKSTPIYKVHTFSRGCIHMPHDSACMLINFHPCKALLILWTKKKYSISKNVTKQFSFLNSVAKQSKG